MTFPRLWWDSPIVQTWVREGSVAPPVYLDGVLGRDETLHLDGCTLPGDHLGACNV